MKTPSIGDRVRVKKEKLNEITSDYVRGHVSGEGTVVENFNSGWFTVEFDSFKWRHGFYGDELEVIAKKQCECIACEEKRAKELEMARDIQIEMQKGSDDHD